MRTAIFGITGSGKTVFATEEFNKYTDLKIFLNIQNEDYPIKATKVSKIEDINFKKKSYNYPIENIQEIVLIQKYLKKVQEYRMKHSKNARILLMVDEADQFCDIYHSKKEPNYISCVWLAKQSRRYNIDVCWITQRPQLLNKTLFTQNDNFIFFYMDGYDFNYIETEAKITMSKVTVKDQETGEEYKKSKVQLHTEPYLSFKYVIYNRVEFIYCEPLKIDYGKDKNAEKKKPESLLQER